MKQNRFISIALLVLLLGTTAFTNAKQGPKGRGGGGRNEHQAQGRGRQQGQRGAYNRGHDDFRGNWNRGNRNRRIPNTHYRAYFGPDHRFRINRRVVANGYQSFYYNNYWFGYNDPWPPGWRYDDNVYVEYFGGAYRMCNPRHPGIFISLRLF